MSKVIKYKTIIFLAAIVIFSTISLYGASMSPSLENLLFNNNASDSLVTVVVFASNNTAQDMIQKAAIRPGLSRRERHEIVINTIQSGYENITANLADNIKGLYGDAEVDRFWVAPAVKVTVPASILDKIAELPGVSSIIDNAPVDLIKPIESSPVAGKVAAGAQSHLTALNIPALWRRGLTGKGRLVCSFDTGVESNHPALLANWRGLTAGYDASFFAPSSPDTIPYDKTGHGTHTMGLMVGSDGVDTVGVAPDAKWITAAVVDQGNNLQTTFAEILAAFEWAMDPDGNPATVSDVPDVISNSWGVPISIMAPCDETFNTVIDNVEAAGIVTVFAAGNDGPDSQTLRIPANRASSVYNSFAVGAIDHSSNLIAGFSSRGPSSCDPTQKKPEVVAPGVNIVSCSKNGGYTIKSGTSMSAPLIAGLAVLLRQYNPDATVYEIKHAIAQSCLDLGVEGEDNTYGYGLPDAEAALQYIDSPDLVQFYIIGKHIDGDGIAAPGEEIELYVGLEVVLGHVDSATAILETSDPDVNIINNESNFVFYNKSTTATSTLPFEIEFDESIPNGYDVVFDLIVSDPTHENPDTVIFTITVGKKFTGTMFTHMTSSIEFTVSDIGMYGMGAGSIYPNGGAGFKYQGIENILYESGIIVGRNSLQISSSVRDSLGSGYNGDFTPVDPMASVYPDPDGGYRSYCRFVDTGSEIPIPITVQQSVTTYDEYGYDNIIIIKFRLVNHSLDRVTGLYFGFMSDFDLDTAGDQSVFIEDNNILSQFDGNKHVAILPLTDNSSIVNIDNGTEKIALTDIEKYNLISASGIIIDDSISGDWMSVLSFGPYNIAAHDSVEIALAIAAGSNEGDIRDAALRAHEKFNGFTDIPFGRSILPEQSILHQNYPNPFNPSTTIMFELPHRSSVELEVLNILGQNVITLFDNDADAGVYRINWDGFDKDGVQVGSGIYFYRLKTDNEVLTKKMLMVK